MIIPITVQYSVKIIEYLTVRRFNFNFYSLNLATEKKRFSLIYFYIISATVTSPCKAIYCSASIGRRQNATLWVWKVYGSHWVTAGAFRSASHFRRCRTWTIMYRRSTGACACRFVTPTSIERRRGWKNPWKLAPASVFQTFHPVRSSRLSLTHGSRLRRFMTLFKCARKNDDWVRLPN